MNRTKTTVQVTIELPYLTKEGIEIKGCDFDASVDWRVSLKPIDGGLMLQPKVERIDKNVELSVDTSKLNDRQKEILQNMWGRTLKRKITKYNLNTMLHDAERVNHLNNSANLLALAYVVITITEDNCEVEAWWV